MFSDTFPNSFPIQKLLLWAKNYFQAYLLAEDDAVGAHLFSKIQAPAEPRLQAAANGSILLEKLRHADSVPDLTVLGLNARYERLRNIGRNQNKCRVAASSRDNSDSQQQCCGY